MESTSLSSIKNTLTSLVESFSPFDEELRFFNLKTPQIKFRISHLTKRRSLSGFQVELLQVLQALLLEKDHSLEVQEQVIQRSMEL
jgi:hypothetical protein